MSGRLTQLGRQLRKLRHIVGGLASAEPTTTLRRATQLAADLACEHADTDDAAAGFQALAARGLVEPALAERLAAHVAGQREPGFGDQAMAVGRDLDRFLRSLELGAPAPEIPFPALVSREPEPERAKPDSTAAVAISGRIVELAVRAGHASVTVDEQPIPLALESGERVPSVALAAAPTSRATVQLEPTGEARVVWEHEHVTLAVAPDFTRARLEKMRAQPAAAS